MAEILRVVLFLAVALVGLVSVAEAQQPVLTSPLRVSNNNRSGTIIATDTFQSIAAAETSTQRGRTGCLVQNLSTNNKMYVFFGPIASALTTTSIMIAGGQTVSCATTSGGVITDQVSVTGTVGDAFYAGFQ